MKRKLVYRMPFVFLAVLTLLCGLNGCSAANKNTATTTSTAYPHSEDIDTKPTNSRSETTMVLSEATAVPEATELPIEGTTTSIVDQEATKEDVPATESNAQGSEPVTTQTTFPPATEPPETEPLKATPSHSHSYQKADTIAATCTKDGYTIYL